MSPCSVKKVLLQKTTAAHTQPLNKTKTTTNSPPPCYYLHEKGEDTSPAAPDFDRILKLVARTPQIHFESEHSHLLDAPYAIKSKSPPKYILFKRLKVELT